MRVKLNDLNNTYGSKKKNTSKVSHRFFCTKQVGGKRENFTCINFLIKFTIKQSGILRVLFCVQGADVGYFRLVIYHTHVFSVGRHVVVKLIQLLYILQLHFFCLRPTQHFSFYNSAAHTLLYRPKTRQFITLT